MTDTRGPAPGKVPPHVRDRLEQKRRKAAERAEKGPVWKRWPALTGAAVVVALIGVAIGLGLAGDPAQSAADQVTEDVLPLANQAEAVWRVGLAETAPIADAAAALETGNDTAGIEANHQSWIDEHQRILDSLEAVELDPVAEPVRDLFHGYVRAQLDAVVLLGAAVAHEGSARTELFRAAVRELGRSRSLLSDARTALEALGGPTLQQVDVPIVPGLTAPGRPLPDPLPAQAPTDPSATEEPTSEEPTDDPDATQSETPTDEQTGPEPTASASPS